MQPSLWPRDVRRAARAAAHRLDALYTLAVAVACFPLFWLLGRVLARTPLACYVSGSVLSAVTLVVVWLQFSPEGRRGRRNSENQNVVATLSSLLILVAFCTVAFSYLSSGVYLSGIGGLDAASTHVAGPRAFDASFLAYVWHLADVVPVLKIPETLDWKLAHRPTGSVQGGLVLAYTTVVITPLVDTSVRFAKRLLGESDTEAAEGS